MFMWLRIEQFWYDAVDKIRTLWSDKPNNKTCSVHDFDYEHYDNYDNEDKQFKSLFKQSKAKSKTKKKAKNAKKISFKDPNDIPFGDLKPYSRPKTKKTKK